jgi:hypothetical protein
MRSLNTLSLISASVWHVPFPACPMSYMQEARSCDINHMTSGKPYQHIHILEIPLR